MLQALIYCLLIALTSLICIGWWLVTRTLFMIGLVCVIVALVATYN